MTLEDSMKGIQLIDLVSKQKRSTKKIKRSRSSVSKKAPKKSARSQSGPAVEKKKKEVIPKLGKFVAKTKAKASGTKKRKFSEAFVNSSP